MPVDTFFERAVDQLLDLLKEVTSLFRQAGVPYRVAGGMAVYLHFSQVDPVRIATVAKEFGFEHRVSICWWTGAAPARAVPSTSSSQKPVLRERLAGVRASE